jgi:hypothetical protein
MTSQPEYWLRGPLPDIPRALMPAAHALLQTLEDAERACDGLTDQDIWTSPGSAAPIGFHLFHLDGSTDRLLTYARGERLNPEQKSALLAEQQPPRLAGPELLDRLRRRIDAALAQLRATSEGSLMEPRAVGRAALPTNVLGLLFHTAEHSQRHAGQIVTTAKILRAQRG